MVTVPVRVRRVVPVFTPMVAHVVLVVVPVLIRLCVPASRLMHPLYVRASVLPVPSAVLRDVVSPLPPVDRLRARPPMDRRCLVQLLVDRTPALHLVVTFLSDDPKLFARFRADRS